MAAFRRVVTAFAVLMLLAGLASAQQTFSCTASTGAAPPQLRVEGLTELIGDILLDCTGTVGQSGLANFTVYAPAPITSRVHSGNSGISEALLVIDDAGAPGRKATDVAEGTGDAPGCTGETAEACTHNVFQGLVAVSTATPSVTFLGVPVLPPATPGEHRTFRITNVRVNAHAYGAPPNGVNELKVSLSISGTTTVPVNQTSFTGGFVTKSMNFDGPVDEGGDPIDMLTYRQCDGVDQSKPVAWLRFRKLFATAFKAQIPVLGDDNLQQTIPGASYNTETGLEVEGVDVPARASYGTRLRATFNNIPLGTAVYVSVENEQIGGDSAPGGHAVLHTGTQTGAFDADSGTYAQIVADDETSGTAIWEVVTSADVTVLNSFDFGVFFVAVPHPQDSPATGITGTVTGNYAPTPSSTQQATWSLAYPSYIPRFMDGGLTYNLIEFNICQTNLLFPYVLGGVAGFDTGLSIANTSEDPWGTTLQNGTCTLNFYGDNAPDPYTTPDPIGPATHVLWANTAMNLAPGFQGYIIAQCDFQYAHGFAFVSDIGAHNVAMGYLALILPDVEGLGERPVRFVFFSGAENLNQ